MLKLIKMFFKFINYLINSFCLFIKILFATPAFSVFLIHKNRSIIVADTLRWKSVLDIKYSLNRSFIYLIIYYPEYRNVFYNRIGTFANYIKWFYLPMSTMQIATHSIGEGLFIQHGICTIIAAKKIGKNCWINQQVTIGYSNKNDCPIIGDNVSINAGAKVIGGITLGDNVVVGANAVVVKNVPSNCTVAGVPAKIIKRDGIRVDEKLS